MDAIKKNLSIVKRAMEGTDGLRAFITALSQAIYGIVSQHIDDITTLLRNDNDLNEKDQHTLQQDLAYLAKMRHMDEQIWESNHELSAV